MSRTNQASSPLRILGGLSVAEFLQEYWQKKPLLIKSALPDFASPVSPDELAGLAMEEQVESRIIQEQGSTGPWQLRNGPFDAETFSVLPASHWTLLVQQLDAWVPEINALKPLFNFIPNWRIDDIMASYAPVGGSVGPHFDAYDVFLLQAHGHRHWQVGQRCDKNSPTIAGTSLSILSEFECQQEWTLAPGDMLYLPPNLAHHGVARDDCITLSIGFRAPTHEQLLDDFSHEVLQQVEPEKFYSDPDLQPQDNPGEVSAQAMSRINAILDRYLGEAETRGKWFVKYASSSKNPETLGEPDPDFSADELEALCEQNVLIQQNEGSRFIYSRLEQSVLLGVDGEVYTLPSESLAFVEMLCQNQHFESAQWLSQDDNSAIFELVLKLIQGGSLYC